MLFPGTKIGLKVDRSRNILASGNTIPLKGSHNLNILVSGNFQTLKSSQNYRKTNFRELAFLTPNDHPRRNKPGRRRTAPHSPPEHEPIALADYLKADLERDFL